MNALEATLANLEKRGLSRRLSHPDLPAAPRPESKGDLTTRAARAIIDAEAELRRAKTAALRAARLDRGKPEG
ncbi:hypothetical protein [Limimaricola pyoseonensis]|uniref:hypothetical protein n=1 Tax=Limimaricola pyoseonensis TaxID=521013 RepID=UPI000B7EED85|nr:hypothetical protein [Limimaricola pyoseonensis]